MAGSDLNTVTLVGRLTRDVEVRHSNSGTAVAKLSIANNYYSKVESDPVNFFDMVAFGRTAEMCGNYLTKGKQIAVSGELRQNRWKDKETGQNRSKVEIIVQSIQMLGSKQDSDTAPASPQPQPQSQPRQQGPSGGYQSNPNNQNTEKNDAHPFEEDIDGGFGDDEVPF